MSWKTYLGGAGFVLTGVGSMIMQWYNGNPIDYQTNMGLIFTGVAIIGGRHAYAKKNKV